MKLNLGGVLRTQRRISFVVHRVLLVGAALWISNSFANGQPANLQLWSVNDTVAIQHAAGTAPDEQGPLFTYSADRTLVAYVVLTPHVDTRRRTATLRVFRVSDLREYAAQIIKQPPNPVYQLSLASESNDDAISDVQWSPAGDSLGFLTEDESGSSFRQWHESTTRTQSVFHSKRKIADFRFLGNGSRVALLLDEPQSYADSGRQLTSGLGLLAGLGHPVPDGMEGSRPHELALLDLHTGSLRYTDVTIAGYGIWPSPDGFHIGFWEPTSVVWKGTCWDLVVGRGAPASWPWSHRSEAQPAIFDVANGQIRRPFGGPLAFAANRYATMVVTPQSSLPGIVWSSNSQTAIAPFTFSKADACSRHQVKAIARIMAVHGTASVAQTVASLDDLDLLRGNPYSDVVKIYVEISANGLSGWSTTVVGNAQPRTIAFELSADGAWRRRATSERALPEKLAEPTLLSIQQDYDTPPSIVVQTGFLPARLLYDLAPHLRGRTLGTIAEFSWIDGRGSRCHGLLLYPAGYSAGRRLPLIIQTHGFASHAFYAGGPSGTVYPGRAIADKGFIVLATQEVSSYIFDPQEAEKTIGTYEAAIRDLAERGLIDRRRVGIVGYSRTTIYIDYALVFHPNLFAAAATGEGEDHGYSAYLSYFDYGRSSDAAEFATIHGLGGPWHDWPSWLRKAPDLNASKMKTPLLMEADSGYGVTAQMWPIYAAFKMNNVAVELWTIPDGVHNLVRPTDQAASQQGALDWLRFWIKGGENTDPLVRDKYVRWRTMRAMRKLGASTNHG